MMNEQKSTGKNISDGRKKQSLTQEQLANKLNVTRQAVSNWERNETIPDKSIILKLANILGTSINSLVIKNNHLKKETKMTEKNLKNIHKDHIAKNYEYTENKYDTAIGLFYGLGVFIGILIGVLFVFFGGFNIINIIFAILFGFLGFLIIGMGAHAIISLTRKDM